MSAARDVERALSRLAAPLSVLAPARNGGYGVFHSGDRRRRPVARLAARDVKALVSEGAIVARGEDVYELSTAGRARVRREAAAPDEAYLTQHRPLRDRHVVDDEGALQRVRGYERSGALKRLGALRDGRGAPWLSAAELHAADRLRAAWDKSQVGLAPGSDWTAPPRSGSARGPGNAQEAALAARCDAGRRVNEALDSLAPPLRRVVERVVLYEEGVEAVERAEQWPHRSGKLALRLGLAQLARRL